MCFIALCRKNPDHLIYTKAVELACEETDFADSTIKPCTLLTFLKPWGIALCVQRELDSILRHRLSTIREIARMTYSYTYLVV